MFVKQVITEIGVKFDNSDLSPLSKTDLTSVPLYYFKRYS